MKFLFISLLGLTTLRPVATQEPPPPPVVKLDFSSLPYKPNEKMPYISPRDYWDTYGIQFRAYSRGKSGSGSFPPRLFDTANPVPVGAKPGQGDPDLGSPNQLCPGAPLGRTSWPGVGMGGGPAARGKNCDPQGRAVIIQEGKYVLNSIPDDNMDGGWIEIFFKGDSYVQNIGLLDIDYESSLEITRLTQDTIISPQVTETVRVPNLGDNSFQELEIARRRVTKMKLNLSRSGAITYITFESKGSEKRNEAELAPGGNGPNCTSIWLDFDFLPDGSRAQAGPSSFVDQQWKDYGLEFFAWSGTVQLPVLFDSSQAPGEYADLGSPNERCPDGGGPGFGEGGEPVSDSAPYVEPANCFEEYNVLVAENPDNPVSLISISFDPPAEEVYGINMMNIWEEGAGVIVEFFDDDTSSVVKEGVSVANMGANSMQYVDILERFEYAGGRVKEIDVILPKRGAIAALSYCTQAI